MTGELISGSHYVALAIAMPCFCVLKIAQSEQIIFYKNDSSDERFSIRYLVKVLIDGLVNTVIITYISGEVKLLG